MEESENPGFFGFIKEWLGKIRDWMKPEEHDALALQIIKFILKCMALLVMIALSPVLIVVLVFVFFAAF